ncbi:NAD-dependent epimerase/dehydratase family protein (plasmid) [Deinococcus sp. KNUC1210]|uniref:NAD-dependent epimerase/dehydratase family protein n=1 Tax=Deinococcus sp. KNUC1210 TaxID=2917691 RepID=UPI001EF0D0A8|nr:NAD-dependent epimerase/dehydratase family protein [Deinococcus sp. KNUC1210]ULH17596.1 NAD-dependent epimerase/dehydratase family protein [Deinococcus sp. KNUC1210]
MTMPLDARIYIATAPELVEVALLRRLNHLGFHNVTLGKQVDLRSRSAVMAFFEKELPDYVFLNAANLYSAADPFKPATWLHDNLLSVANVIEASYLYDVTKLLCLDCASTFLQPMILPWYVETLPPEQLDGTLRACQVTRRAIVELCRSYRAQYSCDFVSAVTSNVYGAGRWTQVPRGHLVPALIKEVVHAKELELRRIDLLGGAAQRHDLVHLDDLTEALVYMMNQVSQPDCISVESGQPHSLAELARLVGSMVGYQGQFEFVGSGPFSVLLDRPEMPTLQSLGWQTRVPLGDGLHSEYRWYLQHRHHDQPG